MDKKAEEFIRKSVKDKILKSFFVEEEVSAVMKFELDLDYQKPVFKKNIINILTEGFVNLYMASPEFTMVLINKFNHLDKISFQIQPILKNQKMIPRPLGGEGPLWRYEGGTPDLTYIMRAQVVKQVGTIVFNYFHFFFENKREGWESKGFPSLFYIENIHPYNKTAIFHEWLHLLGVQSLENHEGLTFQEKGLDPVYTCSNMAFPDNITPSFLDLELNDGVRYSITPSSCLNCIKKSFSNYEAGPEALNFCSTYHR